MQEVINFVWALIILTIAGFFIGIGMEYGRIKAWQRINKKYDK